MAGRCRAGGEGGADGRQGEGGDGGGDDAHHGADEPAVGVQCEGPEPVVPRGARTWVGLQDGEGLLEGVGGLHPPVGVVDVGAVEGGGVQDGLDDGLRVHPPDPIVAAVTDAGVRGEGLGAGGGAHRVLAAVDRIPRDLVREAVAEHPLRVEHPDRAAVGAGGECRLEVVGLGGGGDDRAGRVQDRVDRHVQALAGSGGSDHEDAALHRRPHLLGRGRCRGGSRHRLRTACRGSVAGWWPGRGCAFAEATRRTASRVAHPGRASKSTARRFGAAARLARHRRTRRASSSATTTATAMTVP